MDHVSSLVNSLLALYTLVCILCRDKVSMFSGPKIAVQYIALLLYSMWHTLFRHRGCYARDIANIILKITSTCTYTINDERCKLFIYKISLRTPGELDRTKI